MAPLTGLKVVEAANFIAGPYGAMILADLGAEVIKIEPPRGDPYRRVGKQYGDSSLQFKATNQSKSSVTIDLKSEAGQAQLFDLLADADVLITNWRPSVAERMGLDPESVREQFPQLIWVRVSGYGQDGPREDLAAYDSIIQARSGIQVFGSESPINTNNNVADKVSAMFAAQTVTAALHQRARTGTGSVCDVAMVDVMAYFYGADASAGYRIAGAEPVEAIADALIAEFTYETAEGHIALSPVTGRQLRRALEATGAGDRFGEVMDAPRDQTMDIYSSIIAPALMSRSAQEWEDIFIEADVPAAAVRSFDQHLTDPQTVHNQTYRPVPDDSIDGDWLYVSYPAFFDGARVESDNLTAAPPLEQSGEQPE